MGGGGLGTPPCGADAVRPTSQAAADASSGRADSAERRTSRTAAATVSCRGVERSAALTPTTTADGGLVAAPRETGALPSCHPA
jgi:hypothetical protein